jgi:hypothetical protein
MEKMEHDGKVYRLPPDKKNSKGERVRKGLRQEGGTWGTLVCSVRDGRQFYTKRPLTESK